MSSDKIIKEVMLEFADSILSALDESLPVTKDATGNLRDKTQVSITQDGAGRLKSVSIEAPDYWINVDKGRRAGAKMPPFNAIRTWVIERGKIGGFKYLPDQNLFKKKQSVRAGKAKPISSGKVTAVKATERKVLPLSTLVYLIQRKIARDGIEPTNYVTNVLNNLKIEEATNRLSELLGQNYVITIVDNVNKLNGNNNKQTT
jgi:hypothetical protein